MHIYSIKCFFFPIEEFNDHWILYLLNINIVRIYVNIFHGFLLSFAYQVWSSLKILFCDKKNAIAIQLNNAIWNIVTDDSSLSEDYTLIKTISNILDNIEASVP